MARRAFNGGCELVAVCEPDLNAMKGFWAKAGKTWPKDDIIRKS